MKNGYVEGILPIDGELCTPSFLFSVSLFDTMGYVTIWRLCSNHQASKLKIINWPLTSGDSLPGVDPRYMVQHFTSAGSANISSDQARGQKKLLGQIKSVENPPFLEDLLGFFCLDVVLICFFPSSMLFIFCLKHDDDAWNVSRVSEFQRFYPGNSFALSKVGVYGNPCNPGSLFGMLSSGVAFKATYLDLFSVNHWMIIIKNTYGKSLLEVGTCFFGLSSTNTGSNFINIHSRVSCVYP